MENRTDEGRFFNLINSFPGVVYECLNNKNWSMTFISKGSLELTGYPPEDFIGTDCIYFSDLILPEFRDWIWLEVQKALKDRKVFQLEYKIKTSEGKEKWVFEQGQGIFDEAGNLIKIEGFINDISQRKLTEEALVESEGKYNTWARSTDIGIWQIDRNYETVYVNRAMCIILGISSPDELKGKLISTFFTQESLKIMEKEHQLRTKNISSSYEAQLIRPDGELRDVSINGTPLMDAEGNFQSFLGTFVDITEQKTATKALLKSEERFRILFESSPFGQSLSRNGKIIQVNQAFAHLFGYSDPEELTGKYFTDFIAPSHKSEVEKQINLRSQGEDVSKSYELTVLKRDGEEFSILAELGYIDLPDGKATLINIKDITETKLKEKQLRESEAKFRTLFESELMGIVISQETGDILEANNAFLNMLGFTKEDLEKSKLNWMELTPPEYFERDVAGLREIVETGIMRPFEKEYIRKDGKRISVIIGASLLGTEGKGVTFIIDVSELRQSQKQLEMINKELNTFLYMASHDLKGPLATVVGLTQIAKNETQEPHIQKYLNLIMQSTSKLDNSLMNLMRIMKIKGGGQQTEPVDFNHIIEEVKENLNGVEGFKDVKILSEITLSSPFYSESSILNSILQNLIENGVKYKSSQADAPFVCIKVFEEGQNVVLKVEDNGKGIDPKVKDRIFDMFYRGTSDSRGSGLGLYIVKNAVERLHGKIEVTTRPEGGTIFTVVFPRTLPVKEEKVEA
jgi:PAS domain S-box-containing protein